MSLFEVYKDVHAEKNIYEIFLNAFFYTEKLNLTFILKH